MRTLACLSLLLFAALAVGCDSDSPLQVGTQTGALTFDAPSALIDAYLVWDVTEDSDGIDGPDDVDGDGEPEVTLWCELSTDAFAGSVPWTYAVTISVLRVGEVVAVPLTTDMSIVDGRNRAEYDSIESNNTQQRQAVIVSHDRGVCSGNTDITCNPNSTGSYCQQLGAGTCNVAYSCSGDFDTLCSPGSMTCENGGLGTCVLETVQRRFEFDNQTKRKLTAAHRDLLDADGNLISHTCSGSSCMGTIPSVTPALGVCPGNPIGEPTIDGNTNPAMFEFELNKGDTVIVEAKRFSTVPQISGVEISQPPGLRASMFLDGKLLSSDEVQGNLVTPDNSTSSSISFFFTSK